MSTDAYLAKIFEGLSLEYFQEMIKSLFGSAALAALVVGFIILVIFLTSLIDNSPLKKNRVH